MDNTNDGIDELKLQVLKQLNLVIKGHNIKREQVLTVGDVLSFIDIAIVNVKKQIKLKSEKVHS